MQLVSDEQITFGRRLGLALEGMSVSEAMAMIHEAIDRDFLGLSDLGEATRKQLEFAAKFQRDLSHVSRRVADAVVEDLMTELNLAAIQREQLAPGVRVRNKHEIAQRKLVISSIQPDGTVYFKGGNGARAWARSLVRVGQ
ncbi:MAG: hypothetical protein ACRED5_17285 [Propylenella sp.]